MSPIANVPLASSLAERIREVRGRRVLLDSDLAAVFGVPTHRLNEAVGRNIGRFPEDFSFLLENQELRALISQFAISKTGRGGRRKPARVFTEHGAIMAANLLNSPRAVQMSVYVVRASHHTQLARELEALRRRVDSLDATAGCSER